MNLALRKAASIASILLTASLPARASLGDAEASVEADRAAIEATSRTLPGARFTVHELQVPSGTTIREYVSPAGVVFGLAWHGPSMPDLRQLLGSHFDAYADALAARRMRRSPVFVQLPGLVVQSSGHARSFVGKAYLSDALPQGVSPQDVQ
ncbi:MAG TPA: DUF2844 domain-containing protein [Casimicrobiaceae bacterium]|nr:DUF2844 domain-containing protein [Casimicrobiaceae bacterium]